MMGRIDIRRILCPVDLSETSGHALQHALRLARWYGSEVTVLSVVPTPIAPIPIGPPIVGWSPADLEEVGLAVARFAQLPAGAGVPVRTEVLEGPIVLRILEEARRLSADLIVMGTHGATGFERFVLGSVAEKTLRKAPCPVLTVPPAAPGTEAPGPYRAILCGVDFSPWSLAGLRIAASLAEESGGRLVAACVVDWPSEQAGWAEPVPDAEELMRRRERDARGALHAAIPAALRECADIVEIVASGRAHEQLLTLARMHAVDLLVLGVHGRGALDLALFGSTTNQVVRAATCPVLTVRS